MSLRNFRALSCRPPSTVPTRPLKRGQCAHPRLAGPGAEGALQHQARTVQPAAGDEAHQRHAVQGPVRVGGDGDVQLVHRDAGADAGAAASQQRLSLLPDVPTISESGVPEFEASSWVGIVAPAKTPEPVVAKLNAAINQVLKDPDVRSRIAAAGADTTPGTPQAFRTYQAAEIKKWGEVIKGSNITAD